MGVPEWAWEHIPTALQWLTTGIVTWIWWSLKRTFVTREEFFKADERQKVADEEQDRKIARLLEDIEKSPDTADLYEIKLALERLNGRIDALQKTMDGQQEILRIVRHQAERMNAFLMEHGG
jgi:hypothetical protein